MGGQRERQGMQRGCTGKQQRIGTVQGDSAQRDSGMRRHSQRRHKSFDIRESAATAEGFTPSSCPAARSPCRLAASGKAGTPGRICTPFAYTTSRCASSSSRSMVSSTPVSWAAGRSSGAARATRTSQTAGHRRGARPRPRSCAEAERHKPTRTYTTLRQPLSDAGFGR